MAKVPKSASRVAFSLARQPLWGAKLLNASLSQFLTLQEPLRFKDNIQWYDDTGAVGTGHNWETQRGILARHVEFEIPVQPLPNKALGVLLALAFSESAAAASAGAEGYTHIAKFIAPETRDQAWFTTLAVRSDLTDLALVDVACTSLTIRGEGNDRLQAGGSFVASAAVALTEYSWPAKATLHYLWNYSGIFEINDSSKRAQMKGFELTINPGVNIDLGFEKRATEAERIYPGRWPYTPQREVDLSLTLLAEQGDKTAWEAARSAATELKIELSCLGAMISSEEARSLLITMPKAVIDDMEEDYPDDLLQLTLKLKPHYDETLAGPLSLALTDETAQYLAAEA